MPDTTNPELTAVSIANVDITGGATSIPFSAGAFDTGSGVDRVVFTFDHSWQGPGGLQNTITFLNTTDSFADGLSSLSVFFGAQSAAETYTISSVQVYDQAGNLTTYSTTDLLLMNLQSSFTISNRNLAPTATVAAPAYLTEDQDASAALTVTLLNVSQWHGSVTMSYDTAASTAINGSDVNFSTFIGQFNVDQASGNYTINLPSFSIIQDHAAEGIELIAISLTASGQIFDSGTESTTVYVPLLDDHRTIYDPANSAQLAGNGSDTLFVSNLAAPTTFNLAAHGFSGALVAQADTAHNAWALMLSSYNAAWQLTSVDLRNDDGSHTFISVDFNGTQSWTQEWFNFDPQGRLSSEDVLGDDGTHTFIRVDAANLQPWSQDWFTYDAQGRLTSEDVRNDDGSHTFIRVDADGSKSWTQDWFTYDSQGRLTSEDVRFDDGTHTFIRIDAAGTQTWFQDWFTYDAQGRLTSEDVRNDDGTHTFIRVDAAGSQTWSQDWFTYDAQGRLTSEDVRNDDGSHTFISVDADGSQPWSQEWYNYDPVGHLTSTSVVWDDGHVTYSVV